MITRILVGTLVIGACTAATANEYGTREPSNPIFGFSLSITEHPGLCAEDARNCRSTTAPVYRWPVVEGDRIVVADEWAKAPSTAVFRSRHLFVPVDVGTTPSSRTVSIRVVLSPTPQLIIERANSRFTMAADLGRWIQIPSDPVNANLFVRLDAPAVKPP